jgi:hypothetical protein
MKHKVCVVLALALALALQPGCAWVKTVEFDATQGAALYRDVARQAIEMRKAGLISDEIWVRVKQADKAVYAALCMWRAVERLNVGDVEEAQKRFQQALIEMTALLISKEKTNE